MGDDDERTRERAELLASYDEALDATLLLAPSIEAWDAPTPCGAWMVVDLAGHLAAVVGWPVSDPQTARASPP